MFSKITFIGCGFIGLMLARAGKAFQLEHGCQAPWYMGYAWYNPLMNYTVILPIPFNHIAAILRAIYFRLRYIPYSKFDLHIGNILRERFHEGYQAGYADGERSGRSDYVDAFVQLRHLVAGEGEKMINQIEGGE